MDVAHCHLDFPSTPKQINPTNDCFKKKRAPQSDRRKPYLQSIKVGNLTKRIAQTQSNPIILITWFWTHLSIELGPHAGADTFICYKDKETHWYTVSFSCFEPLKSSF